MPHPFETYIASLNPIHFWALQEESGSTAADIGTGTTSNATHEAGATVGIAGPKDGMRAVGYDGTSTGQSIADHVAGMDGLDAISVLMVVRRTGTWTASQNIVIKGDTGGSGGSTTSCPWVMGSGTNILIWKVGAGVNTSTGGVGTGISEDAWTLVLGTWEPGEAKLYTTSTATGELVDRGTNTAVSTMGTNSDHNVGFAGPRNLELDLAYVAVFDRVLTAQEREDLMAAFNEEPGDEPEEEDIIPYATLTPDPTTTANIRWLDESNITPDEGQTLAYGIGEITDEVTASRLNMPSTSSTVWRYEVELTGLQPGTEYIGEIRHDGVKVKDVKFRTLPAQLTGTDTIKIGYGSDFHMETFMTDPDKLDVLAEREIDIFWFGGDMITSGTINSTNSERWREVLRDYYGKFVEESDFLVPIVIMGGNHDLGNNNWDGKDDGTNTVDPDMRYFRFLFKYPRNDLGNFGAYRFANTQLIAMDTHSAFIAAQTPWLQATIDKSATFVIPGFHSPMTPGAARQSEDPALQAEIRDEWAPVLWDAGNVPITLCGHLHVQQRTVPLGIVDDEVVDASFALDNGKYLAEHPDGWIEIGQGWPGNRTAASAWHSDKLQGSDFESLYLIEIGVKTIKVEAINDDGEWYQLLIRSIGTGAAPRRIVSPIA